MPPPSICQAATSVPIPLFGAGGGVLLGEGTTMNYSGGTIRDNKATDLVDSGGGGILAFKAISQNEWRHHQRQLGPDGRWD